MTEPCIATKLPVYLEYASDPYYRRKLGEHRQACKELLAAMEGSPELGDVKASCDKDIAAIDAAIGKEAGC